MNYFLKKLIENLIKEEMSTKSVMFQGTTSDAGKSFVVAALCRILKKNHFRVVPFKSQNMSLNSFITKNGKEMSRSQAFQAEAAGVEPEVSMNPILLKPSSDMDSQVIISGKIFANMDALTYQNFKPRLKKKIGQVYNSLTQNNDAIVLEGAGSPAEINLNEDDIVNMGMAKIAKCPVILVADIDKGGVFASIYGTLKLLDKKDRKRVKGIIINKFRGDKNLLKSGNQMIEKLTGVPVVGVLPWSDIDLDEEDSVVLNRKSEIKNQARIIDIAVISLPKISNFTDFHNLEIQPDVSVRYVVKPEQIGIPDVLILPGSKNTNQDLFYLRKKGFIKPILKLHLRGCEIVGICGGFQMLGLKLDDPLHIESKISSQDGLGLLPIETKFNFQKKTTEDTVVHNGFKLYGYEIHMGITNYKGKSQPFAEIIASNGKPEKRKDGLVNPDKNVWGTYLHGIFDNEKWTRNYLNKLRIKRGLKPLSSGNIDFKAYKEKQYQKLAQLFKDNVDMFKIKQILDNSVSN